MTPSPLAPFRKFIRLAQPSFPKNGLMYCGGAKTVQLSDLALLATSSLTHKLIAHRHAKQQTDYLNLVPIAPISREFGWSH